MTTAAAHPRLTLAMIVANDPEGLERTLSSVHDVVDDIVICDTGDRDSARMLAPRFHARVVQQPWCDSFSVARNECLRHVLGNWVLWLDAGETLSDSDKLGLREHVLRTPAGKTAYMMIVKRPPAAGTIAGEQIARTRLVPVRPGIWFRGRVRESLGEALESAGITIEGLPFRIARGASEHDPEQKLRRARRNIELADLELRDGGPKPRLLNCLAEAFLTVGEFEQARAFYQQAADRSPRGSADLLEAFYGLLTVEEAAPQGDEQKLDIGLKALEYFPLDMQLLCAMGGYLQAAGQWDLSLRSYETAYRFGQIQPELWHVEHVHAIAAECYALSLQLRQRGEQASQVLEEAAHAHPDAPRLQRQLLDVYIKQGRSDEAVRLAATGSFGSTDAEMLKNVVLGACHAAAEHWSSARRYLQQAYHDGCRDPLCLRWLGTTLLQTGDHAAAHACLGEWAAREPHNSEPRRLLASLSRDAASLV